MLSLVQLYTDADTNDDANANDDTNNDNNDTWWTNHDCIGSLACMLNEPKTQEEFSLFQTDIPFSLCSQEKTV